MPVSGSDRIFAAALAVAREYRTFSPSEIEAVVEQRHDDGAPSRRTIHNHLNALVDLDVLKSVGMSRTLKQYRFREEFDPSR